MASARSGGGRGLVVGLALLAAVVVLAVVLLVQGGGREGSVGPSAGLTATPVASASPAAPTPGADAGEGATADTGPPGTTDAVAAAEELVPEGAEDSETAIADLDGDGRAEVVVASLVAGRSRVDLARWDGSAYAPVFGGDGGAAEALSSLEVGDINGSPGTREVVVHQTSGSEGASASLWGADREEGLVPLTASGGCWDGSHTYGIIGVTIADGAVLATCDGSPDPFLAWPSDRYTWDAEMEAFAHQETVPAAE